MLSSSSLSSRAALPTQNILGRILFGLLILVGYSCHWHEPTPPEVENLLRQSPLARGEQLRSLPIEEQLRIYRYGMMYHPPLLDLGAEIARGGKAIIPSLLEALQEEKDDRFKAAIVQIFSFMSALGYAEDSDIGQDAAVMTVLRTEIVSIQDKFARRLAESSLARIITPLTADDRTFLTQSHAQQREQLRTLSLDKLLQLYRRYPTRLDLQCEMAARGKAAMPILLQALHEQEEVLKEPLLRIFQSMSLEYYDLRHEAEVLERLTAEVDSIRDEFRRQQARERLTIIRGEMPPQEKPFCGSIGIPPYN